MDFPEQIRDAIEKETKSRDEAVLGYAISVAGIVLRPMTMGDWLNLIQVGNGFVCGLEKDESKDWERVMNHARQFVWVMWSNYEYGSKSAKRKLTKMVQRVDPVELVEDLAEYVTQMMVDQPAVPVSSIQVNEPRAYWSPGAAIIHSLGKTYGWSKADTLDTPIPLVWQLMKLIRADENPKAPQINPSDALITGWMKAVNAERKNRAAAKEEEEEVNLN